MTSYRLTDGVKDIPLSALRPEAWTTWGDAGDEDGRMGVTRAARLVPYLYRAIDIRAKSVASVPFALYRGQTDITKDEASKPLVQQITTMLRQSEGALCFYGASYYELATNSVGRNLTPFWLLPSSVQPAIDVYQGLQGFRRLGPGGLVELGFDEVIYTWLDNYTAELGPGIAPAAVVLSAAGMLHDLDTFASSFFRRGGVKMTLLTVEGDPKKGEVEKLDAWWKRMVGGVKSAFGSVVIRAGVKPQVIGSDIKDTNSPQLTKLAREDVATGMGVPFSLLASSALAGGTADAERLNYYDLTILPECELLEVSFNTQWLDQIGVRMAFQPERLEVYQRAELGKAQSIAALVGQPVMTIDEGRARLELPPMAQAQPATLAEQPPTADSQPPTTDGSADPQSSVLSPAAGAGGPQSSILLPGTMDALKLWQRKALRRLRDGRKAACDFSDDTIDALEHDAITHALAHATTEDEIKRAFVPGEGLSEDERALYERVRAALTAAQAQALRDIPSGSLPSLQALSGALRAALLAALTTAVNDQLDLLASTIGVHFDAAATGADIAAAYITRYLKGIEDTTRAGLEQAITAYRSTPGMTRADLIAQLRGVFGDRRAELIAITSLTEASNQATRSYQQQLAAAGIQMERVWRTGNDERVCPVCGPLNGKPESAWVERFPNGAPAHVRCRCATTLRSVTA